MEESLPSLQSDVKRKARASWKATPTVSVYGAFARRHVEQARLGDRAHLGDIVVLEHSSAFSESCRDTHFSTWYFCTSRSMGQIAIVRKGDSFRTKVQ
jgi:hypothetical protein